MTEKINEQNPDLVCIAGDIFDNEYDALDDPGRICELLSSIRSTYGTYACWGNHDISEKLLGGFSLGTAEDSRDPRMEELLTRAAVSYTHLGIGIALHTGDIGGKHLVLISMLRRTDPEIPALFIRFLFRHKLQAPEHGLVLHIMPVKDRIVIRKVSCICPVSYTHL